jgi:hypothetical protein
MPQLSFRLHSPSVAMRSEDRHREIVTIPARASVMLVSGDITGKGTVTVRYLNEPLEMLAVDLRTLGRLEQQT